MHRGYRFRLYPTSEQADVLGEWVGITRLVYNLAWEQRRDFWRQYQATEGRRLAYVGQCRELTKLRAAFDWIAAVPQTALEAALNDLDKAFENYFRGRADFPGPRRLGINDACRFRARDVTRRKLSVRWHEVRLPKFGWVRFRSTRDFAGELRTVTVTRQNGQWFVTFLVDEEDRASAVSDLPGVGIDRGVANTLTLSTGEIVSLPCMAALTLRRKKAQRILARRKRGSRRYAKQRRAAAALTSKMARIRAHRLHEASASIARRFGAVALEDLRIKNMTAKGRGKRGLNRSILHQGWGMFAAMLEYKLEAAGGRLAYVPAAYTSQTCSACGVVDPRSRKSQATFECVHCGHQDHADINAAIEIKRRSTAFVEGSAAKQPCEARTLAA